VIAALDKEQLVILEDSIRRFGSLHFRLGLTPLTGVRPIVELINRVGKPSRPIYSWNGEFCTNYNNRIIDIYTVGLRDLLPLVAITVVSLGNIEQSVAGLDSVRITLFLNGCFSRIKYQNW
jgi:hypothetical protein